MIIKRRTEHRVRMGEFESVVISAEIELDSDTLAGDLDHCVDYVNGLLDRALADDVKELQEIADRDSYITDWRK